MDEPQSDGSAVKYVEELTEKNDYWLSITDAARATRRQDVTIRTWIAKGLLPVRRRSVGLNKRTRQVRVSDLKQLTEIIDPTAVITSEQGKLDLVSIPAQQQQILAEYKQVSSQVEIFVEQLEDSTTTIQKTLEEQHTTSISTLTQLHTILLEQQAQAQETRIQLQATLSTTTQETQIVLLEAGKAQQGQLHLQLTTQQETAQEYQTALLNHLSQQTQQIETTQNMLGILQTHLTEQSTVRSRYVQTIGTLFEAQRNMLQALEHHITTTTEQLIQHLNASQETIQNTITQQLTLRQEAQENEMRQSFGTLTQTFMQQLSTLLTPISQQLSANNAQQTLLTQYIQATLPQSEQQPGLFPEIAPPANKGRRARGKE